MSELTPKILVVDDCQNICKALERLFRFNDCDLIAANSGTEGLRLLDREGPFDVVIADYFMPQLTGVSFLYEVNRSSPETFCVLLTGFTNCQDIDLAFDQGLEAALVIKPWDDETLVDICLQAVSLRQAGTGDLQKAYAELSRRIRFTERTRGKTAKLANCWEYMSCGREPGGDRVDELGPCAATISKAGNGLLQSGHACWAVAGTFCGGEVQGSFAQKFETCLKCPFYREVHSF